MKNYRFFLIDLDGTLTDPKTGITRSVQYALGKMGIVENDLDSLEKFIGPPLGKSFREYYGMDKGEADIAIGYYREYFSERGIFENEVYPGIEKLLGALGEKEKKLFVATSKPEVFAKKITDHFGLTRYFEGIEGSQLDGTLSDKAELIRYIMEKHSLDKAKTIMIGDRDYDIIGARDNRIDSIGAGYGYGSRSELIDAGATYYVESVEALSDLLLGKS